MTRSAVKPDARSADAEPSPRAPAAADATRLAAGALLRGEASLAPRLLIVAGPGKGRALRLGPDQTVGRGRRADLRLDDPAASRLHVRLSHVDGRIVAADLGSKNGVRVNDRPLSGAVTLTPGDEVAIGSTRLRLEAGLLEGSQEEGAVAGAREPPVAHRTDATPGRRSGRVAIAAALAALAAALLAVP